MTATLVSMTVPIIVLLIIGAVVIGLAWWLAVQAEGRDEWLTGVDETELGTATVVGRKNKDGSVTIVRSSFDRKDNQ